jgi:hypothetical protein
MVDHAAARDQRKPDGDVEAERVKEGRGADDAIVGADPEELGDAAGRGFGSSGEVEIDRNPALRL